MLKIRTTLSLVFLALTLLAAFQVVPARAAVNSNPSYDPADSAAVISNQGASTHQANAPVPAVPSTLQLCVNTPFGAVASVYACLIPSQIPAAVNINPGGFAIRYFKVFSSPNPDPQVRCVDAPNGAVASAFACPNPSQIPAPVVDTRPENAHPRIPVDRRR